jgi:hypothetical protein
MTHGLPFNIWVPLPDVADSVACLTTAHTTIQRYQALELVEHLLGISEADSMLPADYERTNLIDHPVVDMWRGHTLLVAEIGLVCSDKWASHTLEKDPLNTFLGELQQLAVTEEADFGKPRWWGDVDVHLSHQTALLVANPVHYVRHFHPETNKHLVYPKSAYA